MDSTEGRLPPHLARYEAFIHDNLAPSLQSTLDARDAVYERISDYLKLRNTLDALKDMQGPMKTQVDLGSNIYMQAVVEDVRWVYVDVGFGFHLQMTHDEARAFIDKQEARFQKKAEAYTDKAAQVRAQIKVIMETMRQLMELDPPTM